MHNSRVNHNFIDAAFVEVQAIPCIVDGLLQVKLANRKLIPSKASYNVLLSFREHQYTFKCRMVKILSANIILGISWLLQVNPTINWQTKTVSWDGDGFSIKVKASNGH